LTPSDWTKSGGPTCLGRMLLTPIYGTEFVKLML
jgi:hypothetical protein